MAPELLAARASRRTNEFALLERAANYNVDIQNYIRELKRNPGDRSMMKEAKFLAEGALPPEELLQQREAAQRNTLQWSAAPRRRRDAMRARLPDDARRRPRLWRTHRRERG